MAFFRLPKKQHLLRCRKTFKPSRIEIRVGLERFLYLASAVF